MYYSDRTHEATRARRLQIELLQEQGRTTRDIGHERLCSLLFWAVTCGTVTEPESRILTGKRGLLKRFAGQGWFTQKPMPAGLIVSLEFPHQHYFLPTSAGLEFFYQRVPDYMQYILRGVGQHYAHEYVGRIEAAWRFKSGLIDGFAPEFRLSAQNLDGWKHYDALWTHPDGKTTGVEVENFDHKTGNKLARFVSMIVNDLIDKTISAACIIVPSETQKKYYAAAFSEGASYYREWIFEQRKWWPVIKSQTQIDAVLAQQIEVVVRKGRELILVPDYDDFLLRR